MIAAGLAGLMLGCLLGLRFRVLVLLPVEMAALALAATAVASGLATGLVAAGSFALFSVGVQVSYMIALALPSGARRAPTRPAEA